MSCIHCNSSPLKLLTFDKKRQNGGKNRNLCWFSGYSTNKHYYYSNIIIQGKVGVVPLKVEDFATSLNLAVAKPPSTQVFIQISALLIFFYLIANFAVPQILSQSLENDKVDENNNPKPKSDSVDGEKTSAKASTGCFNSKKPK